MINPIEKVVNLKKCSICGAVIQAVQLSNKTYQNGHYFGLLNGVEYWECGNCYCGIYVKKNK